MALLQKIHHKLSPETDLEKQLEGQDGTDYDSNHYSAILQALFNFTPEQMQQKQLLTFWCHHVQDCFRPLLSEHYADIWSTTGFPQPKVTAQCWSLFQAVLKAVAQVHDAGYSIADILELVKSSQGLGLEDHAHAIPASGQDDRCLIVVFAMICWSSMIHQPELSHIDAVRAPCLAVQWPPAAPPTLKINLVHRPIAVVFRNFQRALPSQQLARTFSKDADITLFVSTINFHSLRTIGKVRLRWVDDLTRHLTFDSRTRTLSVFRLPSFCACTTLAREPSVILQEMVRASFSNNEENAKGSECSSIQLSQEVLMSYRVLFGQSRAARKVGKSLLQKLGSDKQYDPLLVYLCTKSQKDINRQLPSHYWPQSCRDFDDRLQESDCYSSLDDFPLLGSRLAALQAFNLRQRPSRLRDLWRDRRNPLQWYTFWAVLIVGGISNVVAILQLTVAIVQILP